MSITSCSCTGASGSRCARCRARLTAGVTMELTVKDNRVTGTWEERTDQSGYYQGSSYDGAIQMIVDPTQQRMSGEWVGFTRDFKIQTGPWSLVLVTADTGRMPWRPITGPSASKESRNEERCAARISRSASSSASSAVSGIQRLAGGCPRPLGTPGPE